MNEQKLNSTQIGIAGQLRFAMLAILGSDGAIEPVPPNADDEGRDFELHLRHCFRQALSVQVKVSVSLSRRGLLYIEFARAKRRPTGDTYWYFCAYLDHRTLDFADPMFLIPSTALRRGNRPITRSFLSLKADSRDRWVSFRVTRSELGARLLGILENLNPAAEATA